MMSLPTVSFRKGRTCGMDRTLRVTLLANAGLLFEYEGTHVLLDAVFGREGHPFSAPSPAVWQDMLTGRAPFGQIDYLLFTHDHPDHLSCAMTRELLRRRTVKGLFLPDTERVRASGLPDELRAAGTPAVLLSDATDHAVYRVEPQLAVQAFRTRHLDRKYADVKHFCYLLTFGEKRILITADTDYISESLSAVGEEPLRAVFLNPLFFTVLRAGRFFKGKLRTDTFCVYHVPFAADDTDGMRSHLAYNLDRWGADRPPAVALTEPFQQIVL